MFNRVTSFLGIKDSLDSMTTQEKLILGSQIYNGFVAAAVTFGYFTTPNASATEYFADVGVHVLQAFITANSSNLTKAASYGANGLRMLDILRHALAADSTIPNLLNYTDLLNHGEAIAATTLAICEASKPQKKRA
ncbi:MAG: hypothetical protein WAW86_02385 [Gammaproteobacteria bacterium]